MKLFTKMCVHKIGNAFVTVDWSIEEKLSGMLLRNGIYFKTEKKIFLLNGRKVKWTKSTALNENMYEKEKFKPIYLSVYFISVTIVLLFYWKFMYYGALFICIQQALMYAYRTYVCMSRVRVHNICYIRSYVIATFFYKQLNIFLL